MVRRLIAAGLILAALLAVGLDVAHHTFLAPRTTLPTTYKGTGSETIGPFTPAGGWSTATTETFPGPDGLTVQNELLVQIVGTDALIEPGQVPATYDSGPYRLAVMTRPGARWTIHLFPSAIDVPSGRGWWAPIAALGAGFAMVYACHPIGLRRRRRESATGKPAGISRAVVSAPVTKLLLADQAKRPRRRRHISWARALGDQGPTPQR